MSRSSTAHILSTSVKFIVKSIKRSYSTIVMSKNRTLVLTVVRHGQTDSNKEKLMQGKFFHCFENKTEIVACKPLLIKQNGCKDLGPLHVL